MAKLSEQWLGQRNLLAKTKVMSTKSLKAQGIASASEGKQARAKDWGCLIPQKRSSVSQGETKSHSESWDFTPRHSAVISLDSN
jgi:hypothetical protein